MIEKKRQEKLQREQDEQDEKALNIKTQAGSGSPGNRALNLGGS